MAMTKKDSKTLNYLLTQEITPLTLTTLLDAISLFLIQNPVNIAITDELEFGFAFEDTPPDESLVALNKAAAENFNETIQQETAIALFNAGKQYYQEKNYSFATQAFIAASIFLNPDQRQDCLYNLGASLFALKWYPFSGAVLDKVVKYNSESNTGKKAKTLFDKVVVKLENFVRSTMSP